MENKNYIWRPVSEYTGGRVLATNGLDVIIGEINSEGDCKSEEDGSTILCGITGFIKIEEMLPELKESEEERIRKAIIKHFEKERKESRKVNYYGVDVFDILAWLEKQGKEIIPLEEIILNVWELGNYWKELTKGVCNTEHGRQLDYIVKHWKEGEHYIKSFEKQGEKPAEWSEKDEENFKYLVDEIVCLGNSRNSANRLYYDRLIKFLGELKYMAQPREEWCETDERKLDRLIAYFEDRVAFTDKDDLEYAEWLKSLKDRYTWKPSKEQMKALKHASNDCSIAFADMKILATLYEQLKALHRYEQDT